MPIPLLVPALIALGGAIVGGTAVAAVDDVAEEGTRFVSTITKSALLLGGAWTVFTYRRPIGVFIKKVMK